MNMQIEDYKITEEKEGELTIKHPMSEFTTVLSDKHPTYHLIKLLTEHKSKKLHRSGFELD